MPDPDETLPESEMSSESGKPPDERTVTISMGLIWDPDRGWCYQRLDVSNSGFLFDTTTERDDLIDAAEHMARYACTSVFTHAEAIQIRDNAIAAAQIMADPILMHEAIDAVLAADPDRAARLKAGQEVSHATYL